MNTDTLHTRLKELEQQRDVMQNKIDNLPDSEMRQIYALTARYGAIISQIDQLERQIREEEQWQTR